MHWSRDTRRSFPDWTFPDEKDRHVFAAAIQTGAAVIITKNLRDFPFNIAGSFNIEPLHPDEFALRLLEDSAEKVWEAAQAHRQSLKKPPRSIEEYLDDLQSQELPQTAAALRSFLEQRTGEICPPSAAPQ